MAKALEPFLEAYINAQDSLAKAQSTARSARIELLAACIEGNDSTFLKIDDEAIKRFMGRKSWRRSQDY